MKKMFVGDCHGKFRPYKNILKEATARGIPSIQVGDMGVGFRWYGGPRDGEYQAGPPHRYMIEGDHRFIRGNHDNPGACKMHSQWIKDGTVEDKIMYVGGAFSIDREYRIDKYSWWADEELSTSELNLMVDIYLASKPEIMVTHDCPDQVAEAMCRWRGVQRFKNSSRTSQALQAMFEMHQPRIWLFGHWHLSFDRIINSTRFICLNELEWRVLETEDTCKTSDVK